MTVRSTNHYILSRLHFSTTPATQRLLHGCACRRQTKLLAHGYQSAIWGGRSSADTIGHLADECLPEIELQLACPCQRPSAMGTAKHDRDPSRMHAASTSAPARVTGKYLNGDCSNQHITFIRRMRIPSASSTGVYELSEHPAASIHFDPPLCM